MKTLIIHTEDDKIQIIKDFLNSIKVKFESNNFNNDEINYTAEFNEMIEKGNQDIKNGKGSKVNFNDEIWK